MSSLLKFEQAACATPEGSPLDQLRGAMRELIAREHLHRHRLGQFHNSIVEKRLAGC
jgi:hypothetical protein